MLTLRTDGSGRAIVRFPIPNEPSAIGVRLPTQWLVLDTGAPGLPIVGGAAMAEGVELRIGLP